MKCLNCGKTVKQTKGKRAKTYCNPKCQQQHWHKKKREANPPTRTPGRPRKIIGQVVGTFSEDKSTLDEIFPGNILQQAPETQSDLKFFVPANQPKMDAYGKLEDPLDSKINFKAAGKDVYDSDKAITVADEPKMWQEAEVVKSQIKLPTRPYDLKKMAEAGVSDRVAFKRHVEETKMTPGERALILSKLK